MAMPSYGPGVSCKQAVNQPEPAVLYLYVDYEVDQNISIHQLASIIS